MPISRWVQLLSCWPLHILLLGEFKVHNRNGLCTIRPCYLAAELDYTLLRQSMDLQKISSVKIQHFLKGQFKLKRKHPWETTSNLPLPDLSLSIRSTQLYIGVGNKTKHPFKKNALQCTDISLVKRRTSRKSKQQMLVTLLSTLLEGIQIYCD